MKIKELLTQHRSDFTATMECEHCNHTCKLTTGYHDNYYHTKVIPGMHCPVCGKNRAGELKQDKEIPDGKTLPSS
jgi:C4-type Zn-finger protein